MCLLNDSTLKILLAQTINDLHNEEHYITFNRVGEITLVFYFT